MVDSLLEGCQVIGRDFTYLYVNDAVVRQAHKTRRELLGHTMMECYPGIEHTPMFATLRRAMERRVHESIENEFVFADGSRGFFELRFLPVPEGVCILSLDITARRQAEAALARSEEQLRHAQKMEAVGRLAGGVAHDFNNLLSVVLSYATMALTDLSAEDPLRADIGEILRAGERAATLTRQLLAFSRQQVMEPKVLDVGAVLAGMERMIRRLLGSDVDLAVLGTSNLGRVMADPAYIEQIVMNLVVNARDAMPSGGKLTLEATNVVLDADYAREHLGVRAGPHVMLAVSDTGCGMTKEVKARIFEPFFTTKAAGHGTGLGLATVFGIVAQSGGHIWVYSEVGQGTTFKIYFPRTDACAAESRSEPPRVDSGRGVETILVVEDDESVRVVTRDILRRYGYAVLEASGAGDALLVAERHGADIDLLLTDVVMPHLNGPDLAARLRVSRPRLKVVFMSGYTDEAALLHGIIESGAAYLQKPLTPESLTRKVRLSLSAPPA